MATSVVERASARVDFATEPLFTMPPGSAPEAMTSDGHGVAFLELADGRLQAYWDGEGGEPFHELIHMRDKTPAVFVSDDGEHVAYVGGRAGRFFVCRDGREDPAFDVFTRSVPPVFSHRGDHLAYGAGVGGSSDPRPEGACGPYQFILDGRTISTMPAAPFQAVFSPSGERLAFVEQRGTQRGKTDLRIVLDGSRGPWFRGMRNATGAMQFSPDGRRFAFNRIDEQGGGQWVIDDKAQRLTNEVRSIGLAQIRGIGVVEPPLMACFSPDSRRFAYAADVEGRGVATVEDDIAGPRFKGVGMPVFSPDSRHLAYVAETFSKKLCLVADGVAGPEWAGSSASIPLFSADSRRVAVMYLREEGRFMRKHRTVGCVVDGQVVTEVAGDEFCLEPVFSPDGEHVAWWYGHDDLMRMMLDDAPSADEHIAYSAAVFTCTHHLAYAAIIVPGGRVTIMVDGRLGPLADVLLPPTSATATFELPRTDKPNTPFAVSPDGEHVAWAGIFGEEARPVIDDAVGPPFDLVLDSRFEGSGTAVWWAQRDDTVYRVSASAPTSRIMRE